MDANLRDTKIEYVNFLDACFVRADFSGATLKDVNFKNAELDKVIGLRF